MNYAEICIIKRDGKREDFSISKIKNAIGKAFHASGIDNEDKLIAEITMRVISNFVSPTISNPRFLRGSQRRSLLPCPESKESAGSVHP